MRKLLFRLPLLLAVTVLVACPTDCNQDSITSPSNPPISDPRPDIPDEPAPEFNPGSSWIFPEWGDGFTGFGLCAKSPQEQKRYWRVILNHGYSYARVLSETGEWGHFWEENGARGPRVGAGAKESLEECIQIAADEGGKILLVAIATTHRDRGNSTQREKWLRTVAEVSAPFENVRYEVTNEYWHPRSKLQGQYTELNNYAQILRRKSGKTVSTDQNIGAIFRSQPHRYRYDFGRLKMDWPDFHPPRNPDPNRSDILQMIDANGNLEILLGETTSWTANEADLEIFGWLVTTSRDQIQTYMNNCRPSDGCNFVFHSIEGLLGQAPSWMPRRGMFSRSLEIEMDENGRPVYVDGRQGTRRPLMSWNDF